MGAQLQAFYNEPKHLGNLFGVRGPFYGPRGHLGVDFNRHPAGTPIPSWTAGLVAAVSKSRNLGWLIIVRRTDGLFAGFCHLVEQPRLTVGDRVNVGDIVGKVGSTGLFSTGPHLHATLEPAITIGTVNATDPLPYIRKAVQPSTRRKGTMSTLFFTKQGNKVLYALAGDSPGTEANWLETADQGLANALAAQHGNAAELSTASFASWKARYQQPVQTVGGAVSSQITGTFTATV
jgi:hypothetical protein